MAVSSDYLDYVRDQLSGLGGVTSRRMFGGAGLYCDEFFFALIDNDTLYLRVNDANRADFTTRGMGQFRPYPHNPPPHLNLFQATAGLAGGRPAPRGLARPPGGPAVAPAD